MIAVVPVNWSTKNLRRTREFSRRKGPLAEDVFYLVEDGGSPVGWFVFHFERSAELFKQLALLTRKLGGCENANVIVEIAFPAPTRIGEAFALDTENRAALRTFGNS